LNNLTFYKGHENASAEISSPQDRRAIAKPNTNFVACWALPCPSTSLRLRSGQALRDRVAEGFRYLNPTYNIIY